MKLNLGTDGLLSPTVLAGLQGANAALDARAAHALEHNVRWLQTASLRPVAHNEQARVYQFTDETALFALYAQGLVHLGQDAQAIPWHPGCCLRVGPWPLYPDGTTTLGADTARSLEVVVRVDGVTSPSGTDPIRLVAALVAGDGLPSDDGAVLAVQSTTSYPEATLTLAPQVPLSVQGDGVLTLPSARLDGRAPMRPLFLWVGVRALGGSHDAALPAGASYALTLTVHATEKP